MAADESAPEVPGYRITGLVRETERWRLYHARSERTGEAVLVRALRGDGGGDQPPYALWREEPPDSYAALVEREGPLAPERAADVGLAVAAELEPLHEAGMVHGDIAPHRLLFRGSSAELAASRTAGQRDGAPFPPLAPDARPAAHLPPEAFAGGRQSPRSDVYLLASALWTLLTGRPPLASGEGEDGPGAGAEATGERRRRAVPPEPPPAGTPTALVEVLETALAEDPAQRHADARAFARALEAARGQAPPRPRSGSGAAAMGAGTAEAGVGTAERDAAQAAAAAAEAGVSAEAPGAAAAAEAGLAEEAVGAVGAAAEPAPGDPSAGDPAHPRFPHDPARSERDRGAFPEAGGPAAEQHTTAEHTTAESPAPPWEPSGDGPAEDRPVASEPGLADTPEGVTEPGGPWGGAGTGREEPDVPPSADGDTTDPQAGVGKATETDSTEPAEPSTDRGSVGSAGAVGGATEAVGAGSAGARADEASAAALARELAQAEVDGDFDGAPPASAAPRQDAERGTDSEPEESGTAGSAENGETGPRQDVGGLAEESGAAAERDTEPSGLDERADAAGRPAEHAPAAGTGPTPGAGGAEAGSAFEGRHETGVAGGRERPTDRYADAWWNRPAQSAEAPNRGAESRAGSGTDAGQDSSEYGDGRAAGSAGGSAAAAWPQEAPSEAADPVSGDGASFGASDRRGGGDDTGGGAAVEGGPVMSGPLDAGFDEYGAGETADAGEHAVLGEAAARQAFSERDERPAGDAAGGARSEEPPSGAVSGDGASFAFVEPDSGAGEAAAAGGADDAGVGIGGGEAVGEGVESLAAGSAAAAWPQEPPSEASDVASGDGGFAGSWGHPGDGVGSGVGERVAGGGVGDSAGGAAPGGVPRPGGPVVSESGGGTAEGPASAVGGGARSEEAAAGASGLVSGGGESFGSSGRSGERSPTDSAAAAGGVEGDSGLAASAQGGGGAVRSVAPASVGAAGDGTLPSSAHRPDAEPRVPAHAPDSGPTEQGHGDAAPPDGGRPSGDRYAFARVLVTAVLAAGIAVALVGGAALGVAWWMGSGAVGGRQATDPTAQPRGEASAPIPPSLPPQASENPALAPTDVRIVSDEGNTVTLSWTDNTSGRASYHVVGGPVGTAPSTLAEGEPLSTRITITGLNPSFDYCFTVMAVASVDEVAPSENACTQRASDV
ncbi:hypothetical protein GCM10023224_25100 [Streptomonospora halophila]|uniref:Protein kinase domain-containing protein n=1 Tax=Streptomonospora halophila TaxID=427369 RepID=A0ABP9GG91_9ACTN